MGIVTEALEAHTITHICYGDFHKAYPKMLDIPVDQIDLEFANSDYACSRTSSDAPFTKAIGLGVSTSTRHEIESVEEVVDGIRRALKLIPPERIFVDPDCGLKTRTVEEAKDKLRVIVEAAKRSSPRAEPGR